jgi:hypothetical protein
MSRKLVGQLAEAINRAVCAGISYQRLQTTLQDAAPRELKSTAAWDNLNQESKPAREALQAELSTYRITDESEIRKELWSLERELERFARSAASASTDIVRDPNVGNWWTQWTRTEASGTVNQLPSLVDRTQPYKGKVKETGRIVAIETEGLLAGENNKQVNVFVREIENPSIDFGRILEMPQISQAVARLAQDPKDPERRSEAVDALSSVQPQSTTDWIKAYASQGSAITWHTTASKLNGTVAIIKSRDVQVGNYQYQENTFTHTVSPTIDAAETMARNPDVVNHLIDLACSHENSRASSKFEEALGSALTDEISKASILKEGRGVIERPPDAGQCLHVRKMQGVSIGEKVKQTNSYKQVAHIANNVYDKMRKSFKTIRREVKLLKSKTRESQQAQD